MNASKEAKAAGLKSLTQMIQLTNVPRSTLEDWARVKPVTFNIALFGCVKALESIPKGWSYTYNDLGMCHELTHDNYAPDVEDADSDNYKWGYDFIMVLNDVLDQESEWQNRSKW